MSEREDNSLSEKSRTRRVVRRPAKDPITQTIDRALRRHPEETIKDIARRVHQSLQRRHIPHFVTSDQVNGRYEYLMQDQKADARKRGRRVRPRNFGRKKEK